MLKNAWFKLLLGLTILIGSLGFIPMGLSPRANQGLIYELALMAFCVVFFVRNNWLKTLFLYCMATVIYHITICGVMSLHVLFFSLIFCQILANKLNKDRVNFVFNAIAIAALLQSFAVICQYYGVWIILHPREIDMNVVKHTTFYLFGIKSLAIHYFGFRLDNCYVGLLDNSNIAGSFLAMCIPAFFRKKWWVGLVFVIPSLVLVKSLGAIISAGVAVMVFLIYKNKKIALLSLIPIVFAVALYAHKYENIGSVVKGSGRFHVWGNYCTKVIPKKPIFGWGFARQNSLYPLVNDTFRKAIEDNKGKDPKEIVYQLVKNNVDIGEIFKHSHNEILSLIVELGLIGFFILLGYLCTFSRENLLVLCGFISCLMCSLYIFNLHSSIGLLMIVYMSVSEFYNQEVKDVSES